MNAGNNGHHPITEDHEQHLATIRHEALMLIDSAYRSGVREHGGNLWEKKDLLDQAIKEAIDQVVYLLTLRHQPRHA